jgi:hypothetical protein
MIRLFLAVLTVILCATSVGLGQTGGKWVMQPDPAQPGWVFSYWSSGLTDFVALACSPQQPALIVNVSIGQNEEVDGQVDQVFMRVDGLDYMLPWSHVGDDHFAAIALRWPEFPGSQRWAQQADVLAALAAGKPLQIMASRQPDRRDARVVLATTGATDDPALGALVQACGNPIQAPEPSVWSLVSQTARWTAPTAITTGYSGRAKIMLVCGSDGRPFMAAEVDTYPSPEGEMTLGAKIDGRDFRLLWKGWQGLAVTAPPADFIAAMKPGSQMILFGAAGEPVDFSLAGAGPVLDQALAGCSTPGTAIQGTNDELAAQAMLARLKKTVRDRINAECRAMGGSGANVPDQAFEEVFRQNSAFSDVWFYYRETSCIGGIMGQGAGNCGASKCLQQRYLPGETDYFLSDEVLQ